MTPLIADINYYLALGGLLLAFAAAYLLVEHFFLIEKPLAPYVRRYGLWLVLLVGGASVALTLLYSEVFGFVPCGLCWLQRVALYPLPLLAAVALWRGARERIVADFGIALASLGGVIALYQHYLQMGGTELVTCPTAGVGADCAKRILFEFGFVTFPLLSAVTFLFFIAVFLVWRR